MLQERADVWWSSLLRTRFEDGVVEVAWDEFVRLFQAKFVPEHVQCCPVDEPKGGGEWVLFKIFD
ncbi:hypothetical protein Taro_051720 [Colocasia esculenta]|uniref:Retrotransposon gag domain-containing protein n=1 Tax=Colocasia esculenta TaxID=4460 RepID=A0A843XHB6_COLES|nr:hypothetical protein [Colocasia esculenta]